MRTYSCEECGGEFKTDEEPECHDGAGPGIDGAVSICDDCYKTLAAFKTLLAVGTDYDRPQHLN